MTTFTLAERQQALKMIGSGMGGAVKDAATGAITKLAQVGIIEPGDVGYIAGQLSNDPAFQAALRDVQKSILDRASWALDELYGERK